MKRREIYGPSDRHVFRVTFQDPKTGRCTEMCDRCGSSFDGFGTANVWCPPTKAWMAAHPEDDGRPRTGWLDEYRLAPKAAP